MDQTIVAQYSLIAAAIIAACAALAAAFSDSKAAAKALEGMTRQPEMAGKLFTNMLVAIGLIESIPIIAVAGGRRIETVFIGGGTPSLMSGDAVARLLEGADRLFGFTSDCEITLEANPGTVDEGRFRAFRDAGVNRVSVGVQSFTP